MHNAVKIQLPAEGATLRIALDGDKYLIVKNWRDVRYYVDFHYSTKYNKKVKSVGWFATDGSAYDVKSNFNYNDELTSLLATVGIDW